MNLNKLLQLLATLLLVHAGVIAAYSAYTSRKILSELLVAGLVILLIRSIKSNEP